MAVKNRMWLDLFKLCLVLLIFASTSVAQKKTVESELEIVMLEPVIVVKGEVNGHVVNVMLDTCAWPNIIGSHMRGKIKGEITRYGPENDSRDFCTSDNLTIAGNNSSLSRKIGLLDLSPLTESVGTRIDAIIGSPFLVGRIVEFDFENEKIRFLTDQPNRKFSETTKIQFNQSGFPTIELNFGECKATFWLDMAYNGSLSVNSSTYHSLQKFTSFKKGDNFEKQTFDKELGFQRNTSQREFAERLTIFGNEHQNVSVSISAKSNKVNKIGLEILKQYLVVMDLELGELKLRPNEQLATSRNRSLQPNAKR